MGIWLHRYSMYHNERYWYLLTKEEQVFTQKNAEADFNPFSNF